VIEPSTADRVDRLMAAVTSVFGVIGLHTGRGVPATYLPGRTIGGVRLDSDSGQVHVVLELRGVLLDTAERVREAATQAAGVPVSVVVGDVAVAESPNQVQ
jgi:hypothetical protein